VTPIKTLLTEALLAPPAAMYGCTWTSGR